MRLLTPDGGDRSPGLTRAVPVGETGRVTDPPAETSPPAEAPPRARARGRETVGDMVRSLAAVLVLVGVVAAFNIAQQPDAVVREVGYPDAVAQARQQASYDVLAPQPLPAGWRATSARTGRDGDAVTWHLGLVTGSGAYASVEQTDGGRVGFVERFAGGARSAGTVTVAGVPWRRFEGGEPEDRALVRSTGGVTTVVAGSAAWDDLERLAGSLRP